MKNDDVLRIASKITVAGGSEPMPAIAPPHRGDPQAAGVVLNGIIQLTSKSDEVEELMREMIRTGVNEANFKLYESLRTDWLKLAEKARAAVHYLSADHVVYPSR